MRMGVVRTPRLEDTTLAGAPDEDRLPRDWNGFHIRRGCLSHIESYSSLDPSLLVYSLSLQFSYNSVRNKVIRHLSDMEFGMASVLIHKRRRFFAFCPLYSEWKNFTGGIRRGRLCVVYRTNQGIVTKSGGHRSRRVS